MEWLEWLGDGNTPGAAMHKEAKGEEERGVAPCQFHDKSKGRDG